MALLERMARLFRADMHAVLDRIEEPEALLRQALREMEDELAGDEQRYKGLTRELGLLNTRQTELEQSLRNIETELDLCFDAGKEDLARALLKRRLETQCHGTLLARKRACLEEAAVTLEARLEQNRARLDAMRAQAEWLTHESGMEPEDAWAAPDLAVRDQDVELALLREKQRRTPS